MDWVAAVLTLVASQLVAMKRWQGWVLHIVNVGVWSWVMYHSRLWGLLSLEIVFLGQCCWALWRWTHES